MDSVDQVQTSITQVPTVSSLGLCDLNFVQINCQRNINAESFTQGVMDFSWNISGQQRWSPSRSFFRARVRIIDPSTGDSPTIDDDITLSEDCMNQLFSNLYCYVGNVNVSNLSQFCGQASMVRTRLCQTYSWLKSIGEGAYFCDPDFDSKLAKTSVNAIRTSDYKVDTLYLDKEALRFEADDEVTLSSPNELTFNAITKKKNKWI